MSLFADLGKDDSCVVTHACKWLCGRPRWAATFLTLWMQGKSEDSIQKVSSSLLQAIEWYVDEITLPKFDTCQDATKVKSAYSLFNISYERADNELSCVIRQAVLNFAMSGQPSIIENKYHEAVERGLCAVSSNSNNLILGEPLIVEAGIVRFGEQGNLHSFNVGNSAGNASSSGFVFEQWCLPFIKERFVKFVQSWSKGNNSVFVPSKFTEDFRIGWSAYGVIVLDARTPDETMKWIRESLDCPFDGTVPPFCSPDEKMGPDSLFFLRKNGNRKQFWLTLCQFKFKRSVNQLGAIRSITPELFYKTKRGTTNPVDALNKSELKNWNELYSRLFMKDSVQNDERDIGVVNLFVEYPKLQSINSVSGAIPLKMHQEKNAPWPKVERSRL